MSCDTGSDILNKTSSEPGGCVKCRHPNILIAKLKVGLCLQETIPRFILHFLLNFLLDLYCSTTCSTSAKSHRNPFSPISVLVDSQYRCKYLLAFHPCVRIVPGSAFLAESSCGFFPLNITSLFCFSNLC